MRLVLIMVERDGGIEGSEASSNNISVNKTL
jgi:hypothetical protein